MAHRNPVGVGAPKNELFFANNEIWTEGGGTDFPNLAGPV